MILVCSVSQDPVNVQYLRHHLFIILLDCHSYLLFSGCGYVIINVYYLFWEKKFQSIQKLFDVYEHEHENEADSTYNEN